MPERRAPLQIIDQFADIPAFADEAQETTFWGTHRLGAALLEKMAPLGAEVAPPARASKSVTLRVDPALLARLQALARQRRMPYQRLLKQFLEDRLEQLEAGDERASSPIPAPDPETVRQTARSIVKLARDLETAVARLQ